MLVLGVLTLLLGVAQAPPGPDTTSLGAQLQDTSFRVSSLPAAIDSTRAPVPQTGDDTIPKRRRKAVEVSEWYNRRLIVHRYVAYGTIPVFAAQYAAGSQLYTKGASAPTWAKTTHRVGATLLAGMFTVNTVTGAWNWWDSRSAPNGRILRTLHALSMIGTDAAFTYAGAKLSKEAENSAQKRKEHHLVALWSIGVSAASGVAMKFFNR
jgi:hypothetical protein